MAEYRLVRTDSTGESVQIALTEQVLRTLNVHSSEWKPLDRDLDRTLTQKVLQALEDVAGWSTVAEIHKAAGLPAARQTAATVTVLGRLLASEHVTKGDRAGVTVYRRNWKIR